MPKEMCRERPKVQYLCRLSKPSFRQRGEYPSDAMQRGGACEVRRLSAETGGHDDCNENSDDLPDQMFNGSYLAPSDRTREKAGKAASGAQAPSTVLIPAPTNENVCGNSSNSNSSLSNSVLRISYPII